MPVIVQGSEAISAATRADSWLPLRNAYGKPDGTSQLCRSRVGRRREMLTASTLHTWANETAYPAMNAWHG